MCGVGRGDLQIMDALQNGYPHTFTHKDIKEVGRLLPFECPMLTTCSAISSLPKSICLFFLKHPVLSRSEKRPGVQELHDFLHNSST